MHTRHFILFSCEHTNHISDSGNYKFARVLPCPDVKQPWESGTTSMIVVIPEAHADNSNDQIFYHNKHDACPLKRE